MPADNTSYFKQLMALDDAALKVCKAGDAIDDASNSIDGLGKTTAAWSEDMKKYVSSFAKQSLGELNTYIKTGKMNWKNLLADSTTGLLTVIMKNALGLDLGSDKDKNSAANGKTDAATDTAKASGKAATTGGGSVTGSGSDDAKKTETFSEKFAESGKKWAQSAVDEIGSLIMTGKFNAKNLIQTMLGDTVKLGLEHAIKPVLESSFKDLGDWMGKLFSKEDGSPFEASFSGIFESVSSAFGKFETSLGALFTGWGDSLSNFFSSSGSGGGFFSSIGGFFSSIFGSFFANGGIMTSQGPLSLKAYARGGIASSPQLALFGEGSMNEAYVPLPDGRSIPVTMNMADMPKNLPGAAVNISINVSQNGATESNASSDAGGWMRMANRVKEVVRDELAVQQRPGGLLYG